MTNELPVLRLGLAGFSREEQEHLFALVPSVAVGDVNWDFCDIERADAWLVNGSRVQELDDGRIRIGSGIASGHAIKINLAELDRPIAFTKPAKLAAPHFTFDMGSRPSLAAVLHKFEVWLAPLIAQFCLASSIVEHQSALRSGVFDLRARGVTLAVVSMHGETGVLPSLGPADLDAAVWTRQTPDLVIPDNFSRATMSQLMWQYASRTKRDMLPAHYTTGALFFRRPPRVQQRQLDDSHLYLLRELSAAPATFEALQRRSGMGERQLSHHLAALYFVGSITSNPKRAARPPTRTTGPDVEMRSGPASNLPSGLDSVPPDMARRNGADPDFTAPAPIGLY
ncbi:hypothetical protein GHT07_10015 [Caenimonas koreensis DSM 17982]|uniref:Uncharacterized protein n=1 Tax=Caenimonas koreensis DSM 17982 TaxID=1121255 RepID=A0A844B312_9BURK|nr:hypothetical protein [Caenimonas koreensis]MRD47613.1 hypothetical protein [Caenimonas koreensis DSM 17982]